MTRFPFDNLEKQYKTASNENLYIELVPAHCDDLQLRHHRHYRCPHFWIRAHFLLLEYDCSVFDRVALFY